MLCEKFSESWFNKSHTVARLKLRPFCLWHSAYLDLVESPMALRKKVAKNAEPVTWADIELAARICQLRYLEMLPGKVNWLDKLRLFYAMAKSSESDELRAFYRYINDYFSPPAFNVWGDKKEKKRGPPPDQISVASAVIMMFGGGKDTERHVWEMPIGMAYWYGSALHYNRGAPLDYINAREAKFREFLRDQRRKGLI